MQGRLLCGEAQGQKESKQMNTEHSVLVAALSWEWVGPKFSSMPWGGGIYFQWRLKNALKSNPGGLPIWSHNLTSLVQVSNPSFTGVSRRADSTWPLSHMPLTITCSSASAHIYSGSLSVGSVSVSRWTLTHWVQTWYISVSLPNSAPRTQLRRCPGSYSDFFKQSQAATN